ncbi:FecR family protein [Xanthobacteraceae bacterium A53D]
MDSTTKTSGSADLGSSDLDDLHREAIQWVVRLTSGEATTDDAARLRAWRARSPAHEAAFRQASALWKNAGHTNVAARSPRTLSRRLFLGGAGTALAAGWAGMSLGLLPGLDQILADYATGVGEQSRLDLSDGSTVELDGASALDTRFTETARSVRLLAGAAVFDVSPDRRPFRAEAGDAEISAQDAAFALTLGGDGVVVECTRGLVDVSCAGRTEPLKAGERVVLDGHAIGRPERIDPAAAAPWRRGLLVFQNRPLAQVVADINRHRLGRVILAAPGLGGRRVDGVFHLARPDEIVTHLAASLSLSETRLPGGIAILT